MLKQLFNISIKSKKFIAFILTLSITLGCFQAYAENLTPISLVINEKWNNFKTDSLTVGELLKNEKIILHEKDVITPSLDTPITPDLKIVLDKAENVTFVTNTGEEIEFITNKETVGKALNELKEETKRNFKLAEGQSSASKIEDNMIINVLTYEDKYKTLTEEIPYPTQTIENDQLLEGTKNIKVSGVNGTKEILVKETFLEEELVSTSNISEKVIIEPVTEIIEVGTKKPYNTIKTEKGTFEVKNAISMKSTAYTNSVSCTGKTPSDPGYGVTASGMKAQKGVVAVDPKVIPLGTKLYIEGYGLAIAGDTGGAIKGNKVDVFLDTYQEAINYGVRTVKVYILGEQI